MPTISFVDKGELQDTTGVAEALRKVCPYALALNGAYVTNTGMLARDKPDRIELDSPASIYCDGVEFAFGSDPRYYCQACIKADQNTVGRRLFRPGTLVTSLNESDAKLCPVRALKEGKNIIYLLTHHPVE